MTIIEYLENYLGDLEGNFGRGGFDSLNFSTFTTDYFYTDDEAKKYIEGLRQTIAKEKS